jgi:putative heme transporter
LAYAPECADRTTAPSLCAVELAAVVRPRRAQLVRVAIACGLGALVVAKRQDLVRSWTEIRTVSGLGLATLLGVTLVHILTRALLLRSTLPHLQVRRALLVSEASVASQNSIVGGGLVAGGLRITMLRSWGIPGESIGLSLVASSVFAQFALWLLALFFSLSALVRGMPGRLPGTVTALATAVLLASSALWWVVLTRPAPSDLAAGAIDRVLAKARRRVARVPEINLRNRVSALRETALDLLRARGWRMLTLSIASQLALAVVLVVSLRAFHVGGHVVTIPEALTAFAMVRVAASMTPSPGGVGVTEAGLAHLLSTAGGPSSKVLAAVLTFRACTYLLPIPLGAASVLFWRNRLRAAGPSLTIPSPAP